MRRLTSILGAVLISLVVSPASGQTAPDQQNVQAESRSLFQIRFLGTSVSPRGEGLGGATASIPLGAQSAFNNPAFLGRIEHTGQLTGSRTNWLGKITLSGLAGALRPFEGQYGTIGVAGRRIAFDDILKTVRADNDRGFRTVGTYTPSARELLLTYGLEITDRFGLGVSGKYLRGHERALVVERETGLHLSPVLESTSAVDLGLVYGPVLKSVRFGAAFRNYGTRRTTIFENVRLNQVGMSVQLLDITGQLGLSDLPKAHELLLTADRRWGNGVRSTVRLGGEYAFQETIFIRGGLPSPRKARRFSLGTGFRGSIYGLTVQADYAYTAVDFFTPIHRLALSVGF